MDRFADCVHDSIDALDDILEYSLMLRGITSEVQLTVYNGFGKPVSVLNQSLEGLDHRIQSIVDALDNLAIIARVPGGIGAGIQFEFPPCLGQHVRIFD